MLFLRTGTLLFVICLSSVWSKEDYYWREYTGYIPEDAIVVGKDLTGNNLYVGQAYVKNLGLLVAPIYQGIKEVTATYVGPHKVNRFIKILCGNQENFTWVVTNEKNFKKDLEGKNGVIGGHEDGLGKVHIGRISNHGETKIGKVLSYQPLDTRFFYFDKGVEKRLDLSYEVLVFDENPIVPKIKIV